MPYRILMITSEAVPFAKSGGLADMVSALSIALAQAGEDVRILMPLYQSIDAEDLKLRSSSFEIPFDNRVEKAALLEGCLPGTDVPVYFLDAPKYFDRKGLYGPTPAGAYPDNGLRYSLLSRGALCLEDVLNWTPQVYHSHDWPTGMHPVYLRKEESLQDREKAKASVFTIHNMGYQGHFSLRDTPWAGLAPDEIEQYGFLDDNRMNYLKAGIANCDVITTVSPTYAREIQTSEFGQGLEELLTDRKDRLVGIVNGVDYEDWNPEKDTHIAPHNYTLSTIARKGAVKKALQEEMDLEITESLPLFAMVTRLVDQKGIKELCGKETGMLEDFCRNNPVQVVILGTGEEWCEQELLRLQELLPNLAVRITYNNYLSHLIEAGADFFMMPSRYEPCGLNQLYSLKYGTLPIVRRTGGLADTVVSPDEEDRNGTGFVYDGISREAFLEVVERAATYWYEKPAVIREMRENAMKQDFSWEPSARQYLQVYAKALEL